MNIFFLDADIDKCGQFHVDKHVVKMPLEYAQLLSTAHHVHNSPLADKVYKSTHVNHPCAIWTAASAGAYSTVLALFKATAREYHYRYCRKHKSYVDLYTILSSFNPCPDVATSEPPQCMPDEYKDTCYIQAYRNYYMGDKRGMASWSKRFEPDWWR